MKSHTSEFKAEIKLLGKQQDVRITYTINDEQIVLSSEDINSATPNYEASLLKSVMKGLDLDSNVDIPLGTQIKFEYGLLVNGVYEYLNYGNYIVYSSKKQEDTLSYSIKCYDKLLYSMKDYEHIEVTYPITIYEYLKAVCNKIGLQMKETNFANMLRQVPSELFMTVNEDGTYSSMGYTYRDVLDQIAETTGGCICMTLDDKVEIRYINETNDTIDEEYINDTNVNFGEKYGPINSIVLARAGESDKIYKKNQNSINENGLCELMISENQFMNFNDRVDYLQELSDKLFGVEYYLNDFVSTGIMYYDLLDMYNVEIYGKTYNCLMMNDEQDITQGLEENIHTDRPEKSETDYKKADTTDRKINQTYLIVDKQNQKIEALVTNNTELNQKTAQLRIDVDTISGEISDIADVTTTADGNGTITFENVNESEPILIKIHPQTNDLIPLYLDDNIYLSDDLYMRNIELYFKNTTNNTEVVYNIPNELYYLDGIYDEFVIDYKNQQCYITHRIEKINGVKQLKKIETTEELPYPTIQLTEGDYTITIPYNLTTYIYARLMSKNLYTSQFATKVEVSSKITQTAQDITLSTNKKLENYSTTEEMNSAITVKTNEITLATDKKLENYSTTTEMNSRINLKADSITSSVNTTTDNKLKNYSTTKQMNSAIEQKADSITSTVTSSIKNIQVGGTNLIPNSAPFDISNYIVSSSKYIECTLQDEETAPAGKCIRIKTLAQPTSANGVYIIPTCKVLEKGKEYCFSLLLKATAPTTVTVGYIKGGQTTFNVTTEYQKFTYKFTASEPTSTSHGFTIYVPAGTTAGRQIFVHSIKLEEGNKITAWSPAPDDMASNVEMTSKIEQTASKINLELEKKVDSDKITGAYLILQINGDTSEAKLNADKIELSANDILNLLAGNTINLSSKNITITSSNFNLDNAGNMSCSNATINGGQLNMTNASYLTPRIKTSGSGLGGFSGETIIFPDGIRIDANGKDMANLTVGSSNDLPIGILSLENSSGDISTMSPTQLTIAKVVQTSLAEYKKNLEKMQDNAIEAVKNIDIYKYNLKCEQDTDKKHIGFVIGDDYNYSKEVTSIDNTGVDNYSFTSLCCKAIQEQQEQIEELKKEIEKLKGAKE